MTPSPLARVAVSRVEPGSSLWGGRNLGQVEALPEASNFVFEDAKQETPLAMGFLHSNRLPAKSAANPVGLGTCEPLSLVFTPAVSLAF